MELETTEARCCLGGGRRGRASDRGSRRGQGWRGTQQRFSIKRHLR